MAGKGFPESTPQDRAELAVDEGKINYLYDDAIYPTKRWKIGNKIIGNITGGVGHLVTKGKVVIDPVAYNTYGKGATIPEAVIDRWLDDDLDVAEKAVNDGVKVKLSSHARGALIRFTFNVGVGAFLGSTLLKRVNEQNWKAVPAEFMKWVKTTITKNGKKVRVTSSGLTKRRIRESNYFFLDPLVKTPVKTAPGNMQPKATEIAEAAPQKWTPTEIVGAGSTAAGFAVAGFTVTEPVLVYTFAGLLVLTAIVVVGLVVKRQFFTR